MGRPRKTQQQSLAPLSAEPDVPMDSPVAASASADSSLPDDLIADTETSKQPSTTAGSPDPEPPTIEAEAEAEVEEPPPEPAPVVKRKRGRPPRNPAAIAAAQAAAAAAAAATPTKESTPSNDSELGGGSAAIPPSTGKKRRGRPPVRGGLKSRGGPSHVTAVPLDKEGNPQQVENDEIVLHPDPAGEQKVDTLGYLKGGREYRCRTFTIKGRGQRLYMLSTEPARCIGFRDSYLFFQKHKQLFKIIMDDEEKFDMIARNLIPHSYKGRAIGVVTARSVFREFGARIIVGGRKIIDDYWETRERGAGAVEGELADPEDKIPPGGIKDYNRNQYVAWHGASSVYHTGQPSVPLQMQSERHQGRMREKLLGLGGGGTGIGGGEGSRGGRRQTVITDENWMLEHARAASMYNSELLADRKDIVSKGGVYEQHTNLMFLPASTQPTRARWERLVDDTMASTGTGTKTRPPPQGIYTISYTIEVQPGGDKYVPPSYPYLNGPYEGHGMKDLPEEIIESLRKQFGEEAVAKVRKQAESEREAEARWVKNTSPSVKAT